MAKAKKIEVVHYVVSERVPLTVCGREVLNTRRTTRRENVTCPACKQTDAFIIPMPGEGGAL